MHPARASPVGVEGGSGCRALAAGAAMDVSEAEFGRVRRAWFPVRDLDREWVVSEPVFPCLWGLGSFVGGEESAVADRAATVLGLVEPQGGGADRHRCLAPSPGPVVAQGGVVRGRSAFDDSVPDDGGPGEPVEVGAAVAVTEHPAILSGPVELAEVPGE